MQTNVSNGAGGSDGLSGSNGYMELIDRQELQRLQEDFCRVADVCAYCLDGLGRRMGDCTGRPEQIEKAGACLDSRQVKTVIERVEDGSLEDLAIETFHETGDRVAAVAVRMDGRTVLCWVVFDFAESGTDEEKFHATLDLLQDAGSSFVKNRASRFSAEMESRKSRSAEQEMSRNLHTIEATTEIVQLLDSDDRTEAVMEKWLGILGRHLRTDSAQIYRIKNDGSSMEVLCEWNGPGNVSCYDKTRELEVPDIIKTDKPLVISADESDDGLRKKAEALGLQAVMIFPVMQQENAGNMLLSLNHRKRRINWSMPEIKFAADAVKMLQSILTRRLQKNSLTDSSAVLEAVLDNVGCAIYVTQKKTGGRLFVSRRLQSTFARELEEDTFADLLEQGITAGNENGLYEVYHIEKDRWYDLTFREISWVDGTAAMLYSLYDITDKKRYQRKIEQQAYTDFLTGLYNRMCCERDLTKKADIAMYKAKRSGKNQVAKYRAGIHSASGRRLDMEKNMRDAAASGCQEFEVYYQPIIDVQNGEKCAGAEALIRWNSSKLGFITPAEFIPLAEYLGLINPIGNFVLREACIRCHRWNKAGYDYKVNVNLSVVQLLQADVVEAVEQIIEETKIEPRNLTLEVTESPAINDMERMKKILNRIRSLGVRIALDDFGTGYSSLNHIREIPFNMIKVDQSFVKEVAEDAYSQAFVKMVAELAETLGAGICVEGIERESQYRIVKRMKVKYIQGYYFDRPMKQEDFEAKYCEKLYAAQQAQYNAEIEEENHAAIGSGTEK